MNKLHNTAIVIGLALMLQACAGWQTNVGKVLITTEQTVDATMKGWATYVVANDVPETSQTKVRDVYAKYQVSLKAAKHAYGAAVLAKDESLATQASNALIASSADLLQLVNAFQGK